MAKSSLKDRVRRRRPADDLYEEAPPGSQEPRKPRTRVPSGNPATREARGVRKATYTLPLESIEAINKLHAELFAARPGKQPIEKSQIVTRALERSFADLDGLKRDLMR